MIVDEHKLIFIHIPKNAGSSIRKLLIGKEKFKELSRPWKHDTIYSIKSKYPKKYNSYKKFAVVRNPYDRMVSWYSYLKKYTLENPNLQTHQYNSKTGLYEVVKVEKTPIEGFKQWVKDPYREFNTAAIGLDLLKPQHEWVDDTVTVLRHETLDKELSSFLDKKVELPVINVASRFNVLDYYDKRALDSVYHRYKEDFEKFNYKKL